MTMKKTRKEWVKNTAIIFLTIMLILTFFSNTIMNYSLPEVSAQYASPGTVASRVRGTGTVEAAQPYNVSVSEERVVEEVLVKTGDKVKKGKTLFRLSEGGSGSLEEAEDQLDTAKIEYQTKLLEMIRSYDIPNAEIERLKEDLETAQEKKSLAGNKEAQIAVAQNKVDTCQAEVRLLEKQISQLQRQMDSISSEDVVTAAEEAAVEVAGYNLDIAMSNQTKANKELTKAERNLSNKKAELVAETDPDKTAKLEQEVSSLQSVVYAAQTTVDTADSNVAYWTNEKKKADKALEKAKATAAKTQSSKKKELQSQINALTDSKTESEYKLEKANKELEKAKTGAVTEEEAVTAVKTAERALEDKILSLADTKRKDSQTDKIAKMQLEVYKKKIARLEKKVAKLQKEGNKNEVKAPVAGVVSSISAVAGEKTSPDKVLAVIQIVEKGYEVKLQVTAEQAKKVKEGDRADILNVWGEEVTAVISKISPVEGDPKNKQLIFQVGGSVEIGQSLELSVGQQKANYDTVVPNSAIREDNNGKFILIVNAKSSPLGNRYIAQRVKVDVLSQDDTNAAITGELQGGDFIITTSTKPLTDGMQVRLVEGGGL
ncbi:MAG: HlyD family efflux transporter periplasmic adaptor subunit [Acetivibrio ethanolgignens]